MKREIYYQESGSPALFTEREVKAFRMDKRRMKRVVLAKDEVTSGSFGKYNFQRFGGALDDLSVKDLRKRNVRRDLMRQGITW